jgi:ribulose 1,5-bisphosphate synthetase/thiazole synthase
MWQEVVVAWTETHDVTTDKSALLPSHTCLVSTDSFSCMFPAATQGGYKLGGQLVMMQTGHEANWSWCKLVMKQTGHEANWSWCKLVMKQIGHDANWSWSKLVMKQTGHDANWSWSKLVMMQTGHDANWSWCKLVMKQTYTANVPRNCLIHTNCLLPTNFIIGFIASTCFGCKL